MRKSGLTLIELIFIIAGIALLFFACACVAKAIATRNMHKQAVEMGMAEYVITDNATGSTEFKWKKQPEVINFHRWLEATVTNKDGVYSIHIYKEEK